LSGQVGRAAQVGAFPAFSRTIENAVQVHWTCCNILSLARLRTHAIYTCAPPEDNTRRDRHLRSMCPGPTLQAADIVNPRIIMHCTPWPVTKKGEGGVRGRLATLTTAKQRAKDMNGRSSCISYVPSQRPRSRNSSNSSPQQGCTLQFPLKKRSLEMSRTLQPFAAARYASLSFKNST